MDLNEIKSIIKTDGGKFIIVENDKPSLVVISFEDYKKHLQIEESQSPSLFENTRDAKQDSDDKGNEDAEEGKSAFAKASPSAPAGATEDKTADKGDDELTIDDLPL